MKSIQLCLLLTVVAVNAVFGQFLPPRFQNATVSMKLVHDSKFVTGHDTYAAGNRVYQLSRLSEFYSQGWTLKPGLNPNYYFIFHEASQRYLTINLGAAKVELQDRYTTDGLAALYQNFQFVAQTQTDRFKIHTHFTNDAKTLDYVLQIGGSDGNDGTGVSIALDILIGNSENQKFDLIDLNPSVNPSPAIPSLEDKFQGRSVGMKTKQGDRPIAGDGTSQWINSFDTYIDFDQQFKLESTDETGWYKIKHKPSGKYLTIISAYDGGEVKLKDDNEADDNRQKFKFIWQSANTYELHSKYSAGGVGLVLEMAEGDNNAPMRLAENRSINNPWQVFELQLYAPEEARFTSGSEVNAAGKIVNKQYYISSFESLALLEPYVAGSDTFVHVQSHPVYGEQSEWTIEEARKDEWASITYYRIRYGKTGQYLYLPVADENTTPGENLLMRLRSLPDAGFDGRWEFNITAQATIAHTFKIRSRVGTGLTRLEVNDDGILTTEDKANELYDKNKEFFMNLSWPLDDTKLYSIISKTQGHLVSDSGMRQEASPLYHIGYADPSCMWHFQSTGDGYYFIYNNLTGSYITTKSGGNYGTSIKTTLAASTDAEKWQLVISGNYYRLKNKQSGFYLGLLNHPAEGASVYQGLISDAGTEWIITRADYFSEPMPPPVTEDNLLDNFSPLPLNALNDLSYRQKMLQNLGFIADPLVYTGPITPGAGQSSPPDAYTVIRSALTYEYKYSEAQIDKAISNYKLDNAGHRAQVVNALSSYILGDLAMRDRTTWTAEEQKVVKWLEDRSKSLRVSFGNRLDAAWDTWASTHNNSQTDLPFSLLVEGLTVDYKDFEWPTYFESNESQLFSLYEYYSVSATKGYRRPGYIGAIPTPTYSINGALTIISGILFNVARSSTGGLLLAAKASTMAAAKQAGQAGVSLGNVTALDAPLAAKFLSFFADANGVVAVATMAIQALVMKAIDGVKFDNFVGHINTNVNKLKTEDVDIAAIEQSDNILKQLYLSRDLDIIFAAGTRFDYAAPVTYFLDADGDGVTVGNGVAFTSAPPAGYRPVKSFADDCDDNNASVWQTGTFYKDADGDGYTVGGQQQLCYGAGTPAGFSSSRSTVDDCNDQDVNVHAAPALALCAANMSIETDPGQCSALVHYHTFSFEGDNLSFSYEFTGATAGSGSGTGSGSAFNKGLTHVKIFAANSCGTASCSFSITVEDKQPPVLVNASTPAASLNLSGVNECLNAAQNFNAASFATPVAALYKDNCSTVSATLKTTTPALGNSNCAWSFTYTFEVKDQNGNTTTASVTRSGGDQTPPVVSCPANVTLNPVSLNGTVFTYSVDGTDNCGGMVTVSQAAGLPANAMFPIGTTTNAFVVRDVCNNGSPCSFSVTVRNPFADHNAKKLYVCHKGKTNEVNENALAAHLAHGDMLGRCEWYNPGAPLMAPATVEPVIKDVTPKPLSFMLSAAPNPFSKTIRLQYSVPYAASVNISIYDAFGREVGQVFRGRRTAGVYYVEYNTVLLAGGVYYCRMMATAGGKVITQSQKLLKAD